jgi:hypothetical protein
MVRYAEVSFGGAAVTPEMFPVTTLVVAPVYVIPFAEGSKPSLKLNVTDWLTSVKRPWLTTIEPPVSTLTANTGQASAKSNKVLVVFTSSE